MTKISSTFSDGPLFSPRTADYVATLIREGDNFDYSKWLERIRGEEADTEKSRAAFNSNGVMASEGAANSIGTPGREDAQLRSWPASTIRPAPLRSLPFRSVRSGAGNPEIPIRRRLEKVHNAFDEFQASRVRDAVYGYLTAVFETIMHYKVRRKTKRLLRHAFELTSLPLDKNADPFTAVIRYTCDDHVDSKTTSKWARALRYVAHCKVPPAQLRTFIKETGGVNACADKYAKYLGRYVRSETLSCGEL